MGRSCKFSRRFSLLPVVVPTLTVAATVVSAQERPSVRSQLSVTTSPDPFAGKCYAARAVEVYIPMSGGAFEVAVAPNSVTIVNFPRWITLAEAVLAIDGFEVEQRPHQILITPLKGISSGTRANVAIRADKFDTIMNTRLNSESDAFTGLIEVKPLPDDQYERRITEIRTKEKQRERERNAAGRLEGRRERARALLSESRAYPADRQDVRNANEPYATLGDVWWLDGQQYMQFAFYAPVGRTHELSEVRIREGDQEPLRADVVMQEGVPTRDDLIAVVGPNRRIEGMVLVPEEIRGDVDSLSLVFYSPNGIAPVIARARVFRFTPIPPEEVERQKRARQVRLTLRIFGGAFWIADGVGGQQLEATSFTGLGVRITKGISTGDPSWAFEAELAGARTGRAQFQGISTEGVQGDLARSAMLGRAQLGAMLRFGNRVAPTARLGVGVQGASFDAEMMTPDGSMTGLDSAFEFNGFLTFGGGVDVAIGDHFAGGIAATFELPLVGNSGDERSGLSASLGGHLSYGW